MNAPGSAGPADDPVGRLLRRYLFACGGATPAGGVVLAVSGGPDSTALMAAAAALRATDPAAARALSVATVDHGLRPEARAEADRVAGMAASLGLDHRRLAWTGQKPASGVQAAARAARYGLLGAHARALGAAWVLTGHTRDDQAETVLMRLIAGSGPRGLAGMRPERDLAEGVRLGRPFLGLPKADLVAYCEARGLDYLRDPSNTNERFVRARLRRLMPGLAREGLGPARLCRLAARSARDEAALGQAARGLLAAGLQARADGSSLDGATLRAAPEAVALRAVGLALERAGGPAGQRGPVRLERLERLVLDDLLPALREGRAVRRTLAGVLVSATPAGTVDLRPAPARRPRAQTCRQGGPGQPCRRPP